MATLTSIRKQIAALEAQAERITKIEMSAAIAKVKTLMSEFGLTIEHLTQSVVGKQVATKAPAGRTAKPAKKTPSVAKYADPKSGKTWSGFGRAPAWLAGAKNRDAYLVSGVNAASKPAAAKTKSAKAKTSAVTKAADTKTIAPKTAATKKPAAVKKAGAKKVAKAKTAAKKATRKASAKLAAPSPAEASTSAV